jgi:uncharacterized membrane protein YgdD (TMEM256/DUF423 family)
MNSKQDTFRKLSALNGIAVVSIGAFGAHGLEGRLSPEMMEVYQTGVLYHLIHAAALFALVMASEDIWSTKAAPRVAIGWLLGTLFFSGSLYALAISGVGVLGAITPFGGVAFIAGWTFVFGLRPGGTQS